MTDYGSFDFGLTSEQEERAARLHAASMIIDILYQGPLGPDFYPEDLSADLKAFWAARGDFFSTLIEGVSAPMRRAAEGKLDVFRDNWLASGLTAGNRQVELSDLKQFSTTFSMAQYQFDGCDWMVKGLIAEDFRRAKREGNAVGFVSTQLGSGAFPDLEVLRAGYQLGLRMVQLTYNSQTTIAAGCTDRTNAGVSNFGRAAIELMNELGIIVDTGHCGKQTTLDACELSSQPVVASHTAVESVTFHDRCKSDEELKALAATGGVIGIVTVPFFLKAGPGADMNDFLDHVDYAAKLVGPEHLAIGTDWPMQLPEWILADLFLPLVGEMGFREEHRIDPLASVSGFSDYLDFPNVTRGLVSRGYSDDEIAGILGGNFLRVFEKVCG
jgi:membrane dipeptidase